MADITSIIVLRAEGRLAQPTVESARRAATKAQNAGLVCESLIVLDAADAPTRAALAYFGDSPRVETCAFGDRGFARDFGASRATGECLSFLDGGDLMGLDWLVLASRALREAGERECVVHAHLTCYFGGDARPTGFVSPDMDLDRVGLDALRARPLWTEFGLASATLHRSHPWGAGNGASGFVERDWIHRTAGTGVAHLTAPGTVHFKRRSPVEGVADRRGANPDAWPSAFGKA